MKESLPNQGNYNSKTKKQILVVFIFSLVLSSLMVFFAVATKTQHKLNEEQLRKEQKEQSKLQDNQSPG